MKRMLTVTEALSKNTYPGRGILIGRTPDGTRALIAYFIMGRSENSRNRVFVPDGEGLRTKAFDPSKLKDPSLIIYSPVRVLGDRLIVTNGDQTDTIYDFLSAGKTFEEALRERTFEPDGPNWTPRISGLAAFSGGGFSYRLSILKSEGEGKTCQRFFYEYEGSETGLGRLIHTYREDGDPLPSFSGEPVSVATENDSESFANRLWDALNPDNRVSLFVRSVDLTTHAAETIIINRNK